MADVLPPPLSPENMLLIAQEAQMEAKDCMDESETTGSSSTTVMGASSLLGKTKVAAKAISSGKRKLEKTQQQNEWINEKMNALHDLIPNSSKVDEVSMLDDVIQYIKLLQCQYHIMCSFGSSGMMGMPSPLMVSLSNQASFPPRKLNICVGIPSCYPLGTVYGVSPRTMSYVPTTTYGWENIQKYECNEGLQDEESNSMLNLGDHIEACTNLEGKNKKTKIGQQRNHHRCCIK